MNLAENQFKLTATLLKRYKQFCKIDDNTKRFKRIIELGKKLEPYLDEFRTENHQVKGCASLTYINGELKDGLMQYTGDSNSHLVKGLVALLVEGFSGYTPNEVIEVNPAFIEDMGLSQTLTASRANGFMNTYQMMMDIASRYI